MAEENAQHPEDTGPVPGRPWGRVALPPLRPTSAPLALRLDLTGVPIRGPRLAPVTLILIGSLDTYGMYETARAAYEVWSRHQHSVRLAFLQAPQSGTSQRIALLLSQVALLDEGRFWRLFDGMLELLRRSIFLRYQAVRA